MLYFREPELMLREDSLSAFERKKKKVYTPLDSEQRLIYIWRQTGKKSDFLHEEEGEQYEFHFFNYVMQFWLSKVLFFNNVPLQKLTKRKRKLLYFPSSKMKSKKLVVDYPKNNEIGLF